MKSNFLKRALTLAVAGILTLGSVAAAVSADGAATTATLKISDSSANGDLGGNTYSVYQVMAATANEAGTAGTGEVVYTYAPTAEFVNFFGGSYGYTLNGDNEIVKGGAAVASDDEWTNTNSTDAAALASALENYAVSQGISAAGTLSAGGEQEFPIGYYLIAETSHVVNGVIASKPVLVDLVSDKEITVKDDKVELEKVIVEDGERKTNSANIGDVIEYKATTNIPNYKAVNGLDTSKLMFKLTDTFSDGITYNKDVKVTIGGTNVTAAIADRIDNDTQNGFIIELTPDQILKYQNSAVVLEYTGTLNKKAKVNDKNGNPNEIQLDYTSNPNEENGYGTLKDETVTYTFGFEIRKVDKNNITEDLAGAGFDIYDGETKIASITYDSDGKPVVTQENGSEVIVEVDHEDKDLIVVKGVEADTEGKTYSIVETKAPEDYSLISDPIEVKITANKEKENDSYGEPVLDGTATFKVSGGNSPSVINDGDERNEEADKKTSVETSGDGRIDVVVLVKDTKGISLPETGSREALFCMIGGALIVLIGLLYYHFAVRRKKA